jgi:KipI family sensor histidine kinase inhibitor
MAAANLEAGGQACSLAGQHRPVPGIVPPVLQSGDHSRCHHQGPTVCACPARAGSRSFWPLRFLPAGPTALLVELDNLGEALSLAAEVRRRQSSGWCRALVDVVPGARTVLLDGLDDPEAAALEISSWVLEPPPPHLERQVEVPCTYDGPDLAFVARHWGLADEEVAATHASLTHRVAFCGFVPGFAYIDGLGGRWQVPRRAAPRPSVPAGSVALAGTYTGIYPRCSPGGWQLIGHTDLVLWDEEREPPALLTPGTLVRFVPA